MDDRWQAILIGLRGSEPLTRIESARLLIGGSGTSGMYLSFVADHGIEFDWVQTATGICRR